MPRIYEKKTQGLPNSFQVGRFNVTIHDDDRVEAKSPDAWFNISKDSLAGQLALKVQELLTANAVGKDCKRGER